MSQANRIRRSAIGVVAVSLCALAFSGCATTMVPSQRLQDHELSEVTGAQNLFGGQRFGLQEPSGCDSCEDRQRLQDYAHHAAPYVAGPFMHRRAAAGYAMQQAAIQPPHSKFHPVPTRPAFETQASYAPPQPIGVHLVPIPERGLHSMTPDAHTPDLLLVPPGTTSAPLDANDVDGADSYLLLPPSN